MRFAFTGTKTVFEAEAEAITSYARATEGEAYLRHRGILVPTPDPQRLIDEAYARDPISAAAEYGAQFRTDVEALLTREAIEACLSPGVLERPYIPGTV